MRVVVTGSTFVSGLTYFFCSRFLTYPYLVYCLTNYCIQGVDMAEKDSLRAEQNKTQRLQFEKEGKEFVP